VPRAGGPRPASGVLIVGVWLRSHEEEDGPVRVYRPASYPFPPARGREGLRFDADGGFGYLAPGPDDRPRDDRPRDDRPGADDGTWRADSRDPALITARVSGQVIRLRVVELTAAVLRLEWTTP
jgi:hypothetical protein